MYGTDISRLYWSPSINIMTKYGKYLVSGPHGENKNEETKNEDEYFLKS